MTSPSNGSTFTSTSVTFRWQNVGASRYHIYIGTSKGKYNIYGGSQGTNTSKTIKGLPKDGRTLYVRLYSRINNSWRYNDYSYRAHNEVTVNPPSLYSPSKGSVISRENIVFNWSTVSSSSNSYRIVISRDANFNNFIDDAGNSKCKTDIGCLTKLITGNSVSYTLTAGQNYYWKVRNAKTRWSSVGSFKTEGKTIITGKDLIFPSYGGSNVWKHDHGSSKHKLWYSSNIAIYDTHALDLNQFSDTDNGLPVRPIADGKIVHRNTNYGFIIVEHTIPLQLDNGTILYKWYSGYMHMRNLVSHSGVVTTTTKLGTISNRVAGTYSGRKHLHFAIYQGSLSKLTSIPLYKTNTKLSKFSKKISTWLTCRRYCY